MYIHKRFIPGLAINSYIVVDEASKKAAVIDPVRDVGPYIDFARERGLTISDIFETHVHADFVSGAKELKHALQGKPVIHCSAMGGEKWTPLYADHAVKDGDRIPVGHFALEALHMPGHTPEHVVWKLFDLEKSPDTPTLLFTGDFLFVGDVGRPDLLGEESRKILARDLYESVFVKLKAIDDFVEVFPAHGAGSLCGKSLSSKPTSTLGEERQSNPSLKYLPEQEWIARLMKHMPKAPPSFARMKQINVKGPQILGDNLPGWNPISDDALEQPDLKDVQILDTRSGEKFASGHIPGSINIPVGPAFPTYIGWLFDQSQQFVLVGENEEQVKEAILWMIRVGFDNILGYLKGGFPARDGKDRPVQLLNEVTVNELQEILKRDDKSIVVDVRTDPEWEAGHIEGAIHYQLGRLNDEFFKKIDKKRPIRVICGSGYRSGIMASYLQKEGYEDVSNILGGMTAWNKMISEVDKT